MAKFEDLTQERINHGRNDWTDVKYVRIINKNGTVNYVVNVVRGFYGRDGREAVKSAIALSVDPEVLQFVSDEIEALKDFDPPSEEE